MNKLQKIVQKLRKKRREGAKTNYSKDCYAMNMVNMKIKKQGSWNQVMEMNEKNDGKTNKFITRPKKQTYEMENEKEEENEEDEEDYHPIVSSE